MLNFTRKNFVSLKKGSYTYSTTQMFGSGGPFSAIFFFQKFFWSHIECNIILLFLTKYQILSYCLWIDDILSAYGRIISDTDDMLLEINKIYTQLIFSSEYEINN